MKKPFKNPFRHHRAKNRNKPRGYSPTQIICVSFVIVIALGTLLLSLPIASRYGRMRVIDAMFTATSATCVTGLVVRDTWTQFTAFGQAVILVLIQVGGLGLVTLTSFFALAMRRRMGFRDLRVLGESVSADGYAQAKDVLRIVVGLAALFEGIGILLLLFAFVPQFGPEGIWVSVFTAVSAFCNAGFDLMGTTDMPFVSLTAYRADPVINLTISALIVVGGIGFLTWDDVRSNRLCFHRYRLQSKVILTATALLILLPTLYFFCFEFKGSTLRERLLLSLFQSVTPRTAGFNTADYTSLSSSGRGLTILLMFIGGSPGSTAGGIKTTTIAVLVANAFAVFRRQKSPEMFGRRMEEKAVHDAAAIFTLYLVLSLTGAFAISTVETLPLSECLFETTSAIATVGLSLGLTPHLGIVSQGILIFLMFIGRVGGLTMIYAALSGSKSSAARLPQERITVG